jgi:hypothetical protein
MVREEADHLTRRERAELLRNHSANAKCLLEDAVRARRRAATVCRAPGGPTRESWNMLCQALAVESKLRQEYFDLLSHLRAFSIRCGLPVAMECEKAMSVRRMERRQSWKSLERTEEKSWPRCWQPV